MPRPTREELMRIMFDAAQPFASEAPTEEDFVEALKEMVEDPVLGQVFDAVTGAVWQHGYDTAVATKFPVFGTAARSSVAGDGRFRLIYHFANLDQLSKAEQEWANFVRG